MLAKCTFSGSKYRRCTSQNPMMNQQNPMMSQQQQQQGQMMPQQGGMMPQGAGAGTAGNQQMMPGQGGNQVMNQRGQMPPPAAPFRRTPSGEKI